MEADIVIVGGGTAGCLLAARLSEDPRRSVILIEAGSNDKGIWLRVPAGYGKLFQKGGYHWRYQTESETELNGRSIPWPRGRVLGGSGAVNGLVFFRGSRQDFDYWASKAGGRWSYDAVLPYFRKLETWHGAPSQSRGTLGPIQVREPDRLSRGASAFLQACQSLGFARLVDVNSEAGEGCCPAQMNVSTRYRSSTAVEYLGPAARRPNLTVITDATVGKIEIRDRKAVAVSAHRPDGTELRVAARERIILSAGAIGSPHLLLKSGIGPAAQLAEFGVPVVAGSRNVGRNLQDHMITRFVFLTRPAGTLNEILANPFRKLGMGAQYLLRGKGPLAVSATEAALFAKALPDAKQPQLQFHFSNFRIDGKSYVLPPEPGFMFSFNQCRPKSRGTIELQSADQGRAPKVVANYLASDHDRAVVTAGVRLALAIRKSAPFSDLVVEPQFDEGNLQSDDDILAFVRERATTVYHPAGTCVMGSEPDSVVDDRLKVRGVEGLYVVDASVMPGLPTANPQAATMMIAERWAGLLADGIA